MPTPSNIIEQLKRDEALMLTPYRDSSKATGFEGKPGKLTIGYGRNLEDEGITREEAVAMLNDDIFAKEKLLLRALPWSGNLLNTPDAPRFWVLVNMAFNMGIEGDRKSTRLNSSHPSISYAVF